MSGRLSYARCAGDGLIFREEFSSVQAVRDNGGVVTGTPLANGRAYFVGTARIDYGYAAPLNVMWTPTALTIVVKTKAVAFSGVGKYILGLWNSGSSIQKFAIGFSSAANKLMWHNSLGELVPANPYVEKESVFAWVSDGANIYFYQDATLLGSAAYSVGNPAKANLAFVVGNASGASRPCNTYLDWIRIYNRAWDAATVKDDFLSSVRGMT